MKLTADQARNLFDIFTSDDPEPAKIYGEILLDTTKGRRRTKLIYLTKAEAQELLNNGFKVYPKDEITEFSKTDDFGDGREVWIEW
jgi:hypothetical protein